MKAIFWTLALFALIIFIASLVSLPAWSGTQVWDFENAARAKDWKVANGTWEIKDGVYKETSMAEKAAHSLVGDENWEDYTLEAKIRVDEHRYAGLIFRAISEFEYYVFYVELQPQPNDLCFFKHVRGGFDQRERPNPNKTSLVARNDLKHGEWFTMKIVVEGNNFTCFLNDKETCVGTDNLGSEYKKGKVGVFAWQTKASFDDFTVSGTQIKGMAVDSRNKLAITWGKLK